MKARLLITALAATGLLGVAGFGVYQAGINRGMKMAEPPGNPTAVNNDPQPTSSTTKKILYWHDPMVPGQKFDKPGKSPFMDMQLVPVYADDAGDEGKIAISPRMQQNLGLRTAEVVEAAIARTVEAVGTVAFNEYDQVVVQARNNGFVEKLYVRAPLDLVRKDQPLAELYVPEWVA
ncbi:MAG: efflux RND transporter periplasmic adaptor subunit, partial [Betaproteobacteria bacterium]